MCGIFGTINLPVQSQQFLIELNKMKHRGPDGYGTWSSTDGLVNFGHRRLAIIDTDARSNQPMVFDDRYVIVFNGEIYNYIEIRKQLEKEGVHFRTSSDTEVLMHLIIQKGPSGLSMLNGMWAFALYDAEKKITFFSRDRIGKKPLYYFNMNGQMAFSSEMKNLLTLLPDLEYNREFIDFSVNHVSESEALEETIYKGIKKFPAGSYGWFGDGQLSIDRFYQPEKLLRQKNLYRDFEEAVEHFKELFESSCRLRMRSDVPVGSALSGGIDSSYVVSTIAKLGFAHEGYKALVSSFPGSFLDETADAISIAGNANIAVEPVVVQPDLDPDHLLKFVYHFEEIAGTSPVPFFQLYSAFRDRNVVVTLDGHGSDELFGGYAFDLFAKVKDDFPDIFKMRNTLNAIDKMFGFNNQIGLKQTWPYYKSEIKSTVKERNINTRLNRNYYYKQKLFFATFKGILPTLLRNYDKYSMYAGVEVRMPFLDYRIIEFAFSLPNTFKLRDGYTKAIVRKAAEPIVPKHILRNKVKTGWNSPMGEWFTGPWKQWLLDEIASTSFINCDLVDHQDIRERVQRVFDSGGEHGAGQDLWVRLQPYLIWKANKQFNVISNKPDKNEFFSLFR
jgi:asparagine synthase (glutamine-hydrolysing)